MGGNRSDWSAIYSCKSCKRNLRLYRNWLLCVCSCKSCKRIYGGGNRSAWSVKYTCKSCRRILLVYTELQEKFNSCKRHLRGGAALVRIVRVIWWVRRVINVICFCKSCKSRKRIMVIVIIYIYMSCSKSFKTNFQFNEFREKLIWSLFITLYGPQISAWAHSSLCFYLISTGVHLFIFYRKHYYHTIKSPNFSLGTLFSIIHISNSLPPTDRGVYLNHSSAKK